MDWQEPAVRQQEKASCCIRKERFKNGHRQIQQEMHSPRHLREAQLTVTIKIEHPQLSRKKISDRVYQRQQQTNALTIPSYTVLHSNIQSYGATAYVEITVK